MVLRYSSRATRSVRPVSARNRFGLIVGFQARRSPRPEQTIRARPRRRMPQQTRSLRETINRRRVRRPAWCLPFFNEGDPRPSVCQFSKIRFSRRDPQIGRHRAAGLTDVCSIQFRDPWSSADTPCASSGSSQIRTNRGADTLSSGIAGVRYGPLKRRLLETPTHPSPDMARSRLPTSTPTYGNCWNFDLFKTPGGVL
jgi:hypothetical protein